MLQPRKQGTVVCFYPNRRFGQIRIGGPESLDRYFLHDRFIRSGTAVPQVGQEVTFEVSPEPPRAEGHYPTAIRVDVLPLEVSR
jgi:cold shock CspA family protein